MAKSIDVHLDDESSRFSFARLERERLYGRKERQVIDAEGKRCTSAWLSSDGAALVPTGGLAMLYVDNDFNTIERSILKAVDDQGVGIVPQPSTLGVAQLLEGPVPASRVLDYAIHTVYILTAEELGPKLAAALAGGKIFSVPFSFRDDSERQTLFLVANESGIFALVGSTLDFTMVRRDATPMDTSADSDELSDDLDFSMM